MRQLEMMGRKSSKSEGFSQTASEMSLNSPFTLKKYLFCKNDVMCEICRKKNRWLWAPTGRHI